MRARVADHQTNLALIWQATDPWDSMGPFYICGSATPKDVQFTKDHQYTAATVPG